MFSQPARFFFFFRIEEFDHRAGGVHAAGGIDSWADAKAEIVGSHFSVFATTCNFNQSSQPVISGAR